MKKFLPTVFLLLISFILNKPAFSQCNIPGGAPDSLFPVTNNFVDTFDLINSLVINDKASVLKVLKKDNAYYLLGRFTNIAYNHGPGVVLDSASHVVNSYYKWRIDGIVSCSVSDGSGGFYIGGYFKKIGDSTRNYFAHINSEGQPTAVRLDFNKGIKALYRKNDTLFIGGAFTSVNNQPRSLFAVYSISGDSLITSNLNIPLVGNEEITSMAPDGDSLFIGGTFSFLSHRSLVLYNMKTLFPDFNWHITGNPGIEHVEITKGDSILFYITWSGAENSVKAINVATGQLRYQVVTSLNPVTGSGRIYAIKRVNKKLYIAGDFLYVFNNPGAVPRKGFCAIDAATGNVLPDDIHLNNFGRFLSLDKDKLYVSGIFNTVNGLPREHFVVLDTGTLAVNAWNLSPTDPLTTLSFSQQKIFAGGYFNGVYSFPRNNLAAVDATTNAVLPVNLDRGLGFYLIRYAAFYGDTLFVLGIEESSNWNNPKFIMINTSTNQTITPPPINFLQMGCLGVEGNFLYTSVDQQIRRYFLPSLTRDVTWGRSFNGITGLPFFWPQQLFITNDKVYAIGYGSVGLVVMDKANSQLLGSWSYSPTGVFFMGVLADSTMYVAGDFYSLNGLPRGTFAAINVNNGSVTDWNAPPSSNFPPFEITVLNKSQLQLRNRAIWFKTYGWNLQLNGEEYHGIDAIDTATAVLLPPVIKFTGNGQGYGNYAGNVFVDTHNEVGMDIYFDDDNNSGIVAGTFDYVNGIPATNLAKLHYQNFPDPVSANLSIAGPDMLVSNTDSVKYYVQNSNNSNQSYAWSYTGTGVEIRNNGNDTVFLKASPTATGGILKVKAVNYCGMSPEITKTITIGSTDLTITANSVSTATIPTGNAFTAFFTETNAGNVSAAPNKVYFYISTDNILTPNANGDNKIGEYTLTSGLPPASSTSLLSQQLTIPCSLTPGNYYLFFVADGANIIAESNENNNSVSLQLTITTGLTTPATPQITANPAATVCTPQTVTLTATAPGCSGCSYSWSNGQNGQSIVVSSSGNYTVTASNSCGSASAGQLVTINLSPNVNISQNDTSICIGSSVTLNASGASSYLWSPAAGLNSTTTASVVASPTDTTLYKVTGTSNGCSKTDSVLINVLPQLIPSVHISFTGCPSSTLVFSTSITNGGSSPQFQWFANGLPVGNASGITLNNVANGTQVVCRLTSAETCANPKNVSDTVVINCITTGIIDIDGLESFLVSPNPTPGKIFIQLKLVKLRKIDFTLTDLAGKTLYQYKAGNRIDVFNHSIDLENMPAGIYILKTTIGDKVISQKIAKQN